MKILSGIQPSGQLHIGNYFGMMQTMIAHMESDELYVFIVDLHALTSVRERDKLAGGTLEAAADFLALPTNVSSGCSRMSRKFVN